MLGLAATSEARVQLRALRDSNPRLFELVADRISEIRMDPGGRDSGRAFLLDNGTMARLATFYDTNNTSDLCLVWLIDEDNDGLVVKIVWAAPFDESSPA